MPVESVHGGELVDGLAAELANRPHWVSQGDEQEQHRDGVQGVSEVVGSGHLAGRVEIDRRTGPATVLPWRERHQPCLDMRHVLASAELVKLPYPAPNLWIAQH
jgi:hypothetical protein